MGYADVEKTANGYLVDTADWSEDMAREIAEAESLGELTERHWDLIRFLREEYFDNNGNQPNERAMVKAMSAAWGEKISAKDLFTLFPMQPSKQGTKVAGLPETKRKGGY
ncbi:TusE/DsrC/DsvC family sulfur relay protein [Magnetospira sp. QH-2]|uniref:TusE/DsrC/DsvC family sulfur relay protein n=1 Tax=Magnetospira sp. (strain QH-2) TaxID=1288970 RepID=UPI0003E80D19|nr:TusE/DsrC/DsvC family sulfur relay protein [Magnetospira sp. QH-2]CCQ74196.1 Sulfurtransferase tusE. Subunit of enzyme for 2-thio modification of mnm5s2U of tRNA anticodon U [Magnetospira sp. QH-2]